MLTARDAADWIAERLQAEIRSFDPEFFGTFKFTQTGNNITHPVAWALIARLLWDYPDAVQVQIDPRLNLGGGCKFQPDVSALNGDGQHLIFIDYESPNSSDARIPTKDADAFASYRKQSGSTAPYVVMTTLPDYESADWELRYTANGYYNERFKGCDCKIRENPYRFWYEFYHSEFEPRDMRQIALVNISGCTVQRTFPI